MNPACKEKLSAEAQQDLHWRLYWIFGREYYRSKIENNQTSAASEQMKAWDTLASKAYPDHKFDDGNAELNAVLEAFNFKMWFPGWNDTSCSFDQKEFACFCAWLADKTQEERLSTLAKIAESDQPKDFFCESTIVEKDPIYATNFGPSKKKTSMWPWLIGLAGVGVVGAVVVSNVKNKGSAKR